MFGFCLTIHFIHSKDVNLTDQSLINIFFADLVSTHYRKDIFQNWLAILGKKNTIDHE